MHVLSLPQNKFGLVFFRLFDGALETSNFRFEEARSVITLLRCFLHENTQRGKIARVKFAEKLRTMSKNRLRWITLVRGPIWGIHSLTLMISWSKATRLRLMVLNPIKHSCSFFKHYINNSALYKEEGIALWENWQNSQESDFRITQFMMKVSVILRWKPSIQTVRH